MGSAQSRESHDLPLHEHTFKQLLQQIPKGSLGVRVCCTNLCCCVVVSEWCRFGCWWYCCFDRKACPSISRGCCSINEKKKKKKNFFVPHKKKKKKKKKKK